MAAPIDSEECISADAFAPRPFPGLGPSHSPCPIEVNVPEEQRCEEHFTGNSNSQVPAEAKMDSNAVENVDQTPPRLLVTLEPTTEEMNAIVTAEASSGETARFPVDRAAE